MSIGIDTDSNREGVNTVSAATIWLLQVDHITLPMWSLPAAKGLKLSVDDARQLKKGRQAKAQVMRKARQEMEDEENELPAQNKRRRV